jgi:hypothetical protein
LDYRQFEKKVVEEVQQRYSECEIIVRSINKNNGIKLRGLCIKEPEDVISPTIYLEDFYHSLKGDSNIDEVISEICRLYERHKRPEATDEIMCNIRDWETMADRIYYGKKLVTSVRKQCR